MSTEVKVKFPPKFCDYWWDNPLTWDSKRNVECYICSDPITSGDNYFEIKVQEDKVNRGHLHHLEYAPTIEWVPKESTE